MGKQIIRNIRKNSINTLKQVVLSDFGMNTEMGISFHAWDSTSNIGGVGTPEDTIELYFETPAATGKQIVIWPGVFCSTGGAVFTIREGYTAGGGVSGDAVTAINLNRASTNTSDLTILKAADTITSGGTVLFTKTLTAGKKVGGAGEDAHRWVLAPETKYSVSVKLAAAGVVFVILHWIER